MSSLYKTACSLHQTMSPADFDESTARRLLDKGGKWQNKQLVLLLFSTVSVGLQTLVIVFIGFPPSFTCADSLNANGSDVILFNDECGVTKVTTNLSAACHGGYVYDVKRPESIVSDWDLVCDKAYLSETSQLLFTLGMGAGSAVVPPFSDRLGRRWTLIVLRIVTVFCAFGLALVPNIVWFLVLRFLSGAAVMAIGLVSYVYLVELSSARFRAQVGVICGLIWAVTVSVQSLIAHLLRGVSWRVFQAVICIPNLTVILDVIFIEESLLWLYANGRRAQASALVEKAMKENGMTIESLTFSNKEAVSMVKTSTDTSEATGPDVRSKAETSGKQKVSIIDLIKSKATRRIVPIISITWLTNSLVYYGIFMMSYAMPGDRILNVFINAVVEMPSYLALYLCFKFLSRKMTLVCFHGLCAVSLLLGGIFAYALEDRAKYVMMQVVTFIGKFGISASFMAIYVYTTEVFPTNFRSSGLGIGSLSARCGSVLSSYAAVFAREVPWGPGVIFGTMCLVVTISLFWVPDTKDTALPQTVADVETLARKKTKGIEDEVRIIQ